MELAPRARWLSGKVVEPVVVASRLQNVATTSGVHHSRSKSPSCRVEVLYASRLIEPAQTFGLRILKRGAVITKSGQLAICINEGSTIRAWYFKKRRRDYRKRPAGDLRKRGSNLWGRFSDHQPPPSKSKRTACLTTVGGRSSFARTWFSRGVFYRAWCMVARMGCVGW